MFSGCGGDSYGGKGGLGCIQGEDKDRRESLCWKESGAVRVSSGCGKEAASEEREG